MPIFVLLLGGEPASGKSTVMKEVMENISGMQDGKLSGVACTISKNMKVIVLGTYNREFGGTDTLSMSVQPMVVKMLEYMNGSPDWDGWVVLAEGDRLFNGTFLCDLDLKKIDHFVLAVFASDENITLRQNLRGNKQDPKWLKGRRSKCLSMSEAWDIANYPNDTSDDCKAVVKIIMDKVREKAKWS